MILRIGLTGGIGSGKTTVAKIFEVLGIPVYYADIEAKRIMNEDKLLKSKLIALFGESAYKNDILNRPYISSQVFENKTKLNQLNAIVHPATISHGENWMHSQQTRYAIKEAALIFESGVNKYLDYVIGVSSPPALRIQRATTRDGSTIEEVINRMKNQMGEEAKMKLCDEIIVNDEHQLVIPQVLALHKKFLKLAMEKSIK